MRSIRVKIAAITALAILASILSVFAASYIIIRTETDRNSVTMMNLIDEDTGKSLEQYFNGIEQSVEVAANIAVEDLDSVFLVECGALQTPGRPAVRTPEQMTALDAYLEGYLDKIQQFFSGVADYTQGVSAYYCFISPELSTREPGFLYLKIGKTGFVAQPVPDVTHLTPSEALGTNWYDTALSRGRPCWLGPYVAATQPGTWICSYFVPIYKSGMLIGLMGMDIPCDTLVAQLANIRVYDTGFVCLTNAEGRVIYHPRLSTGHSLEELGLSAYEDLLREDDSGDALIRYSVSGEDRQMSFSTLRNGMKLAVIAPSREINDPWIDLIRTILMIAVAVMVIFLIMSLLRLQEITLPLKELTDASRRLADGDYGVDLRYSGRDEIGTLTGSFTRMRDQIRRSIDDLNHQIYHDRLTDLPNMRHFFYLAEEERERLLAEGRQPVMLYFDIIGLSRYNRRSGFQKGDELLRKLAAILSDTFGEHRVCRFGGDHFAAVTAEEQAEEQARAVLKACETAMDSGPLPVRIGIYPNRLEDVDVNVACDRARFAGERDWGKLSSSVTWYDSAMLRRSEISSHVINSLDRALKEGWVRVYYQPIIRAAEGKVCDEEALARWIDPVLGFLSPGDFIPALEDAGLIYRLDLYVLEQVLEKMKHQTEAGFYLVPQSVNLSRMDFESCDIVEEIRRRVDAAGIDRRLITIEITESVIGADFDFMRGQVARFQALGFPVWMDDFGSGYSSLDVLQHIRFDLIKFDMRFMENFDQGDEARIILTQLMNMAISLGTDTVCEGVETAEQVEFLREIGCTRIQGYYYSKPLPFEGILSLFEKGTTLEFENPAETEYYAALGRVNLYDMNALTDSGDESMSRYFNTLPMCIVEVSGTTGCYTRCNRSYRDFLEGTMSIRYSTEPFDCAARLTGPGSGFFRALLQCAADGRRLVVDEKLDENTVAHTLLRRIAVNPVTGTAAIAVAVLAVGDVDRSAEALERLRAETAIYRRIGALTRLLCVYAVDPETGRYLEYNASPDYSALSVPVSGDDFFAETREQAERIIYPEDQPKVLALMTRENVLRQLEENEGFGFRYRLLMEDGPRWMNLRAALLEEEEGPSLIIGVIDADAQVRQEQAFERRLAATDGRDRLTGVRNRAAYENMSDHLAHQIEDGQSVRYAIVLARVRGLAEVNKTEGREAGDRLIRDVCAMICDIFKHSPVFRVAGDQFAVLAQGQDYERVDRLTVELDVTGRMRGTPASAGMAKYDGAESVASVFARADRLSRE